MTTSRWVRATAFRGGGGPKPSPTRRLAVALGILATITAFGTGGYMAIASMSLVDALYMTVITMTTVGYLEVVPLGPGGRLFTIALLLTSVGTTFYLLGQLAQVVLEGRLREYLGRTAMQRTIDQLRHHVIICGFGRFGRVVARELLRSEADVVIVDSDPANQPELDSLQLAHVIGSALSDDILERAGIRRARALVVATPSDPDNVFITLSAREKNERIRIHARAETEVGRRRLRSAGADQVVSAYQIGGLRIAESILRPSVVDFLEISVPGHGEKIDLEEVHIPSGSALVGRTIRAIEEENARLRIVALKHGDQPIRIIPDPDYRVADDDHLVVIGDRESLERLAQSAQPAGG